MKVEFAIVTLVTSKRHGNSFEACSKPYDHYPTEDEIRGEMQKLWTRELAPSYSSIVKRYRHTSKEES